MAEKSGVVEMREFMRLLMAIACKELKQVSRDKLTLGLLMGVPLIQLLLFGYAITLNPRGLPTAVVANHESTLQSRVVQEMERTISEFSRSRR